MLENKNIIEENKMKRDWKETLKNNNNQVCLLIKKIPEFDSFFNCNVCKFINYIIKGILHRFSTLNYFIPLTKTS